jgi:hypothetical protein
MKRSPLLLATAIGAATTAAIFSGFVMVGRGDASARVARSFQAAEDLPGFVADPVQWTGTWVGGYFLIQGAWIDLLRMLGLTDTSTLVQAVLWLSVVAWAVTLFGAYRAVSLAVDEEAGALTLACLLCIPTLVELSHNAYAEIYFGAFYALGLWALLAFERSNRIGWLLVAGALFLGASTLRTEAVVAAAAVALVVAARHGVWTAASFLTIAASLTLTRFALALAAPETSATFFQFAPQSWLRRVGDLGTLALYLIVPNGIVLGVLKTRLGSVIAFRTTSRPRLQVRLMEYAGASAVALVAFMFAGMLFLPLLGPDSRFLVVPLVGSVIVVVCAAGVRAEEAWGRLRAWIIPWAVCSTAVQIFALGADYLTDRPRPPAEIREAVRWLRENGQPQRLIAVDHLDWWEQTVLLYGSPSTESLLRSYVHTSVPPLGALRPAPRTPSEIGGAYLGAYRPEFLVRLVPAARRPMDGNLWISEPSFLDPWLMQEADRTLVRVFGASTPSGSATAAFRSGTLEILRVAWDP